MYINDTYTGLWIRRLYKRSIFFKKTWEQSDLGPIWLQYRLPNKSAVRE